MSFFSKHVALSFGLVVATMCACTSRKTAVKEEQIRVDTAVEIMNDPSLINAVRGNVAMNQMATTPNSVLLTGLPEHRLVTVYKEIVPVKSSRRVFDEYGSYSTSFEGRNSDREEHYMPGLDLLYGYNLLNLAHYDMKQERLNFLFDRPVLIKSVYYPSFVQDSLNKKPITRDYYLVSVYDADTNKDTLLNRLDLRRLYYFKAATSEKVRLIPEDHSVVRSQYDAMNDVMYVYARQDVNLDGTTQQEEPKKGEKQKPKEPLHIFWIDLKQGNVAKRLY